MQDVARFEVVVGEVQGAESDQVWRGEDRFRQRCDALKVQAQDRVAQVCEKTVRIVRREVEGDTVSNIFDYNQIFNILTI